MLKIIIQSILLALILILEYTFIPLDWKGKKAEDMKLNQREQEILQAILTMGVGRVDTELYPQDEIDALIYKALKFTKKSCIGCDYYE